MRAFELDSLESSHPIEVTVGHPSEINQIFDSISYCKGSAIIRMLNSYMGSADFVKGLQLYLKKYQYKNAQTNDLWQELDNSSNKPISRIACNWTKMAGYPLIQVIEKFEQYFAYNFISKNLFIQNKVEKSINNQNHTILKLSQKRFLKNTAAPNSEEHNIVWQVPITVITKSSFPALKASVLMESQSLELDLGPLPHKTEWILLNSEFMGFYRIRYSLEMFSDIVEALENPTLFGSSLDRIALINDAFALVSNLNTKLLILINLIIVGI